MGIPIYMSDYSQGKCPQHWKSPRAKSMCPQEGISRSLKSACFVLKCVVLLSWICSDYSNARNSHAAGHVCALWHVKRNLKSKEPSKKAWPLPNSNSKKGYVDSLWNVYFKSSRGKFQNVTSSSLRRIIERFGSMGKKWAAYEGVKNVPCVVIKWLDTPLWLEGWAVFVILCIQHLVAWDQIHSIANIKYFILDTASRVWACNLK